MKQLEEQIRKKLDSNLDRYNTIDDYEALVGQIAVDTLKYMAAFAWWCDNNYISYTHDRWIESKHPTNPTKTTSELITIYLETL